MSMVLTAKLILAACVYEYFREEELEVAKDQSLEDPIYKGYKAVLDSKSYDETLVSSIYILYSNNLHQRYVGPVSRYIECFEEKKIIFTQNIFFGLLS